MRVLLILKCAAVVLAAVTATRFATHAEASSAVPVEKLANECNVCHEVNQGKLKSLYGMPVGKFTASIEAYQKRERNAALMNEAVQDLSKETVQALAEHYLNNARP